MKRLGLLLGSLLFIGGAWFGMTTPAMAAGLDDLFPGAGGANQQSSCALDDIGWIACPVLRSTAKAGDYAFTFISQNFLGVEATIYNSNSGTAQAWGVLRNVANVLFVIVFLVVVYSLITGGGSYGYNLKQIIPRMIIAAILANLAIYICAVMVDVSNIAGVSIKNAIMSGVSQIGPSGMPLSTKPGQYDSSVLADITSGVLSNRSVSWVLLAPVTAIVMSITAICSILIVVLIVRKTVIVALILLSSIAIVAYLLPNTEQYFSKWLKLFIQLLVLFPVIATLIGAGQLVSASIIKAGDSGYKVQDDNYNASNGPGGSATLHLVAAGAAVLPLVGTWYAFKAATQAMDAASLRLTRGSQRNREKDEKVSKRERAAMDMNKKSLMLNSVNRLQQLNAAQDSTGVTMFGRLGASGRRVRRRQQKSSEQANFDNLVQDRLGEIRSQNPASPQQMYLDALQRYQDKQSELGGDGVSINSYEGINLKASEAYLLESLGKGGGGVAAVGVAANGGEKDKESEKEKKAAGISSIDRDGGRKEGGDSGPQTAAGAMQNALGGGSKSGGGATVSASGRTVGGVAPTVIVQQVQASGGEAGAAGVPSERRSSANARPQQLSGTQIQAKARANKYLANAQQLQGAPEDQEVIDMLAKAEEKSAKSVSQDEDKG